MVSQTAVQPALSSNRFLALAIACAILLIDICTKALVHQNLPVMDAHSAYPYGRHPHLPKFLWHRIFDFPRHQPRSGLGMFAQYQTPLLLLRSALVLGLIGYFSSPTTPPGASLSPLSSPVPSATFSTPMHMAMLWICSTLSSGDLNTLFSTSPTAPSFSASLPW